MAAFIETGTEARFSLPAGQSLVFYVFRDGEATLRVESGLPGAPYIYGKYLVKGSQTVGPFATACVLRLYAANEDVEFDYGAAPSVVGEGSGGGSGDLAAAEVVTATVMAALVIDVAKELNTKTISTDVAVSFSGTPAASHTLFGLLLTNSDTAAHTITIPSCFSALQQQNITSFIIPASGVLDITFRYTGSGYTIYGEPAPNAYTVSGRPSPSVAGAGAAIATYDPASGLLATQISDGAVWCGEFVLHQAVPSIKLPTSTIGTGASGHLTAGTALPAAYTNGSWCRLEAVASTPAITAGLYWCVFTTTAVGTIYTNGPGSAAFNFSAGGTMTASINTPVNLFVPKRTTPSTTGALIPGNVLGAHGSVHVRTREFVVNNANGKICRTVLGATAFRQQSLTVGGSRGAGDIQAHGSTAQAVFFGGATDNLAFTEGQTGTTSPQLVTVDLTADVRLSVTAEVAVATDYVILNSCTARLLCQ